MLIMALISVISIPTLATASQNTITVTYSGLKIVINGQEHTPKDANGKQVPPFLYEGTNYLPLRAVAEAVGMDVTWEQKTNTAYISPMLNYQGFMELLTAHGFHYSESNWWSQALNEFPTASKTIAIGNENIGVFEYGSKALMEKEAAYIDEGGYQFLVPGKETTHSWLSTPHFFKKGTLIVGYIGGDKQILDFLNKNLGPEFAGTDYMNSKDCKAPAAKDIFGVWFNDGWSEPINSEIRNIMFSFSGSFNYIDPNDFTDMILTRDGKPVENKAVHNGKRYDYGSETGFVFDFTQINTEPGIYSYSGKYKGVPFNISNKIIIERQPIGEEPANKSDILKADIVISISNDGVNRKAEAIEIIFKGIQPTLYLSDLTDLKLAIDGRETPFTLSGQMFRYLGVRDGDMVVTEFHLYLQDAISVNERESSRITITGKYMGVPFGN